MRGEYKVRHPGLQPLYVRARLLVMELDRVELEHVRRDQNKDADRLSNVAMDESEAAGAPEPWQDATHPQSSGPFPISHLPLSDCRPDIFSGLPVAVGIHARILTMILVNIYEAKTKLSEYLEAASRGERVLICRHNRPVAELRPVDPGRSAPRDLAPIYAGAVFTPPSFFEPLSSDEIDAWEGRSPTAATKVAESLAAFPSTPGARRRKPKQ
jgi:prevent-host-death family protein